MPLRGTAAICAITVTSGFGWILFGYDLGVLGGVLNQPNFMQHFPMSSSLTGTVTGVFELAAFVGALLMAAFGRIRGKRDNILVGSLLVAIGAAIQAAAQSIGMLAGGRVVGGVGLGIFTSQCAIWQAETAPALIRGRVVCASLSFLIVGLILAYWIDYAMAGYTGTIAWRFPFGFQIVLCMVSIIGTRFTPESPRWLLQKGREEEARAVLAQLRDTDIDSHIVSHEYSEIATAIEIETASGRTFRDLIFKREDAVRSRRRMLTSMFTQFAQPFSGSTVISFYATTIFQDSVGLDPHTASLLSGYLQIWFLVASFGTWILIEKAGRRNMFMITAVAMAIIMFVIAAMVKINTRPAGIVATTMIFLYQSCYTWGWMAGVWMYGTEIQAMRWRTVGSAFTVAVQWILNYVMLQIVPIAFSNIGYKTYFIFAIFNLFFVPVIYFYFPETAGIPLESIDLLFAPGLDPVKESVNVRKAIKGGRLDEFVLSKNNAAANRGLEEDSCTATEPTRQLSDEKFKRSRLIEEA